MLGLAREVADLHEAIRAAVYRAAVYRAAVYRAAARALESPTVAEDWERGMALAHDPSASVGCT
ncbi:hypothetical protein [Kineococcus glutinatus]|uniref:Uncharacterized protein n=1 Tax=Kineococcus glutinatus TaxID=1070872 RepID=A0ABP9H2K8_9ACTN